MQKPRRCYNTIKCLFCPTVANLNPFWNQRCYLLASIQRTSVRYRKKHFARLYFKAVLYNDYDLTIFSWSWCKKGSFTFWYIYIKMNKWISSQCFSKEENINIFSTFLWKHSWKFGKTYKSFGNTRPRWAFSQHFGVLPNFHLVYIKLYKNENWHYHRTFVSFMLQAELNLRLSIFAQMSLERII